MRQLVNAASPSNFIFTNPELLRTTLKENAENLVRGTHMLAEDIEAGGGELKIRQSDATKFEVGRNLAVTPGKVIHQNELMQLIQYAPTTATVLRRPLLLVPPWINKFYVLDLAPEKSLIKWCVDHGLTVFCVSWVNPDEHLAAKDFNDYMHQGPLEAIDVVTRITGETEVNAVGYCVGGTLLAMTLAYMAAKNDHRIASATLLTTQVDFTYAGDLKVFATTEEQIQSVERQMAERGYLEGEKMATAFNLLRSNDLIWPYVVNNYLKGEAPFPFDLLYWNSDATRMPAANHSYYLRNCYLENNLTKGKTTIDGVPIDLGKVKIPVYNLATREDHIAPAKSVYLGSSFFGGPMRFVLSGSGHIAGVVNPPSKAKYQYWTGDTPQGDDIDAWLKKATEHPGSWWTDWLAWLKAQDSTRSAGARARRRRGQADRGCAGKLCEGAELSTVIPGRSCANPESRTASPAAPPPGFRVRAKSAPRNDDHLREQRDLLQPHRLRKSQHQVHVLHRLAGGALDQVVEHRPMMARDSTRSAATPMKVMLEPRTWRVCGISPNGSTCMKGSSS